MPSRPPSTCTDWRANLAQPLSPRNAWWRPICSAFFRRPWRSVPVFRTASEEETIALGERLAATLPRGATVLLIGNLGAGKTTLAKGIVQGLGASPADEVSSPTFTLIHEYGSPP